MSWVPTATRPGTHHFLHAFQCRKQSLTCFFFVLPGVDNLDGVGIYGMPNLKNFQNKGHNVLPTLKNTQAWFTYAESTSTAAKNTSPPGCFFPQPSRLAHTFPVLTDWHTSMKIPQGTAVFIEHCYS